MDIMGGPEEGHTARRKTDDDEAEVIVVILDFGWGKKCGKKCKRREIGAGRVRHELARAPPRVAARTRLILILCFNSGNFFLV